MACLLLHGIEFLGILINVFMEVVRSEETKVKIHKWPVKNLPFQGNRKIIPNNCLSKSNPKNLGYQ